MADMSYATELAPLFRRDITRLCQEIEAFPEQMLWEAREGIGNTAGNLALHLEGNLRHYIGYLLGGVAYKRERPLEFSTRGVTRDEVLARLRPLPELVAGVIAGLQDEVLDAPHAAQEFSSMSSRQVLMALYGHLSYHLGQIDYLRRVLSGDGAISLAAL